MLSAHIGLRGAVLCITTVGALACSGDGRSARGRDASGTREVLGGALVVTGAATGAASPAAIDREFPLHGLVTGLQLVVRDGPDPAALTLGWLRLGARLRLRGPPTRSPTCNSGWYQVRPRGWTCAGEGITVADAPPPLAEAGDESQASPREAARNSPLPYSYYFVKEPVAPEFHRLPSRDEQREVAAWVARYTDLLARDARQGARFLAGELRGEPARPAVVSRLLDRGFFVAGAGTAVRASRRFVQGVRGGYVKEAMLEERRGSPFHGVELADGATLPVAWAVREAQPLARRDRGDGTVRFVADQTTPPITRLSVVDWVRRERAADGRLLHVLRDGHYLRDWFLAVAELVAPPRGVRDDEPWVHVDVGGQTLVLYRGRTPVFATLVSTGLEGHETPLGEFTIRRKLAADTMSAIGPDVGDDRYSIEDVPWTQYFSGSVALHGAFWHDRFGLRRSHGCVNLAPADAHRLFGGTWPELPDAWHGVSAERTGVRASRVVVTE